MKRYLCIFLVSFVLLLNLSALVMASIEIEQESNATATESYVQIESIHGAMLLPRIAPRFD